MDFTNNQVSDFRALKFYIKPVLLLCRCCRQKTRPSLDNTIQQNGRNVNKIVLKKEGYRNAPMTPRDHLLKRKLGVKGPLDFT